MVGEKIEEANCIAKREWKNIRRSLEMCGGDIGDFRPEDFLKGEHALVGDSFLFLTNLVEMERKLPKHGYSTPEASDVFTILATKAAENLGLKRVLALAFGGGYSYVRTGWFGPYGTETQQILFSKMFFPLGVALNRDFNSDMVKVKLKVVFYEFMAWQESPEVYKKALFCLKTYLHTLSQGTDYDF